MKERCPSGSAPAFLRRRRGRPDRIVGSPGGRGSSPGIGRVPYGRPDRPGANGAFCLSGTSRSPRARHPCSPQALPGSPQALASPEPDAALPQALLARRAHPASARTRPLSGFCPRPVLCAQSPPLSWLSSALRACALAGRKRAFACGVPGALRGTWVSPTRFDEMNDPCPRNVLI